MLAEGLLALEQNTGILPGALHDSYGMHGLGLRSRIDESRYFSPYDLTRKGGSGENGVDRDDKSSGRPFMTSTMGHLLIAGLVDPMPGRAR